MDGELVETRPTINPLKRIWGPPNAYEKRALLASPQPLA
jgi:hypothetical protein